MWPGEPAAGKAAGSHSAPRVLLAALALAATFAALSMLMLPAGRLAWGLDRAAFGSGLPPLMCVARQHLPPPQHPPPQLPQLDLAASSRLHGLLAKAGPQPALEAIANGAMPLDLAYWEGSPWTRQRAACTAPPFPSKWCAAMFNDKYKLIYLKCPKAAGNTLVGWGGKGCLERQVHN